MLVTAVKDQVRLGIGHHRGVTIEADTFQITVEPGIVITAARTTARAILRLGHAGALDQVESGDLLFGLGEGPVAEQQVTAAYPHGRGLDDPPQRLSLQPRAAAVHLGRPRLDLAL